MRGRWILVLPILMFCSSMGMSAEPTLTSWRNLNDVMSVDYEDGVLAVGTRTGLIIIRDGEMMILTEADGLPSDEVLNVAILDRNTFYIGPFGPLDSAQYVYEVKLYGHTVNLRDISPYPPFRNLYIGSMGVSSKSVLWILDGQGLHGFDGESWMHYPPPMDYWDWGDSYVSTQLSFSLDGKVWAADDRCCCHVFDGGSWSEVSDEAFFYPTAFGVDPEGYVWCVATSYDVLRNALYKLEGSTWELVTDDALLEQTGARIISFDEAGNVLIVGYTRLALYNGQDVQLITEVGGFELDRYCPIAGRGPLFSSSTVAPPGTFYLGLYGYGLLSGGNAAAPQRICFEDSLPGCYVMDLLVDGAGQLLTRSGYTSVLGQFDGQRWHYWDAPWLGIDSQAILCPETELALDLDGSVWVRSWEGAVRLADRYEEFYDESNSELHGWGTIAIDRDGVKWFTDDLSLEDLRDVVSFDGETWQRYPATDYFQSQSVYRITTGHDNAIWFKHYDYYEGGYTVFDGRSWRQLEFGTDIPGGDVYFDHEGNTYVSSNVLYRNSGDGSWNEIANFGVTDLQVDSSGALWCGTYEKVYSLRDDEWHEEPFSDVICAPEENILNPMQGVLRILIDHNGDKWFGAPNGLHRIQDGGPAQQKLELSVEEAGGYLTVNATFTNSGVVIPVLLYLACEHEGSLYYYPTWGPTPEGTKRVIDAYSVETEELLRLDTSTLPAGDYTFYGGISLLGGIDLLIGARDNKIAVATYQK